MPDPAVMNVASAAGVSSVAAVWMGVRIVLPWLRTLPRMDKVLVGQRVWALVFASALGVSALAAEVAGSPSSIGSVLQTAGALAIAAIGADKIVSGTGNSTT